MQGRESTFLCVIGKQFLFVVFDTQKLLLTVNTGTSTMAYLLRRSPSSSESVTAAVVLKISTTYNSASTL